MNKQSEKSFKETQSFLDRQEESGKVLKNYPNRIPIIVERAKKSNLPNLTVNKSQISLNKAEAVYLFVNKNVVLRGDLTIEEVYEEYKDKDGFIYIEYCEYNTFGGQ